MLLVAQLGAPCVRLNLTATMDSQAGGPRVFLYPTHKAAAEGIAFKAAPKSFRAAI